MSAHEQAVLQVLDLHKSFGMLRAVNGVSFSLYPGEVLGVAGPNGAGKTTLFSLITKTGISPDKGSVRLQGSDVTAHNARSLACRGMRRTFQKAEVVSTLTAVDFLRLSARFLSPRGRSRKLQERQIENILDTVGLTDRASALGSELTLMERKQLMIASALVGEPAVLLLDEPAGGLSVDEQRITESLISLLSSTGLAVVVIEHVIPLLRAVASRALVLTEGSVLVEGATDDVFSDPRVVEAYLG